jgi:hypothetical protein
MKKIIFFLIVLVLFVGKAQAQVTIGSDIEPNPNALLDLKQTGDALAGTATKGLLLPRVALVATNNAAPLAAHVAGMTVYNTATTNTSAPGYEPGTYVSPGFYYNTGLKWERLNFGITNWFYMPSIEIDTSVAATAQTKDLYALYKAQFDGTGPNSIRSPGAPTAIPYIPAANELYYYITYFDPAVFPPTQISVSATGVLTYDVVDAATECSLINIVFVLK